ncbi:putative Histidine kinase [Candidatus Terasakiella magnetica]|nr:putative Histidine kinase [Candidatus Terasakiella magnetica]
MTWGKKRVPVLGLIGATAALRIQKRLTLLVLACVLPVWLFVGYLTATSYQRGRQILEQSLAAAAQTQLRVVEREVAAAEASLHALATSPSLEQGDYAAFHAQAKAVLRQSHRLNIVLLDPDGAQIINTMQPYGQPLPNKPAAFFFQVKETGKTVLSDLFTGPLLKRPLAALAVPVFRDGRLVNVLTVSLDTEHLVPILNEEGYPDTWAAAVFDGKGTIVARTWEPEKYVGQHASPALAAAFTAGARGLIEVTTLEGFDVLAAFSRSEHYGWTVAVAVPKKILEAELMRSFWINLFAGAALLLSGLALARRISRGITRPVQRLISSAEAIGHGTPIPAEPLQLMEAEEVRRALADAADLIKKRTVERDLARSKEIEVQQQHRSLCALNDIAALPGADAEWQLVESLRLGARHFGLPTGIISHTKNGIYTILHHCGTDSADLADGQTFDIADTYCAITLDANGVVAIPEMKLSEHARHRCYAAFGLEAYIGAPLMVRNRSFGTVSFSSAKPLGRDFEDADKEFIRLLARWIGAVIERQMSDAEITSAKQNLERSNAELEHFAYVASHDLRQPLRMVSSYLGLIKRRLENTLDDELKEFFAFAVDGAQRMDRMTLDLLEYSRVGSDDTPFLPVSLSEAVADALSNLRMPVTESGAAVIMAPDLPIVMGHRSELVRLFQNLIGNAIKYRAAERSCLIEIGCRLQGPDWIIAVRDNGIGIAPDDREPAFTVFHRLASAQAREGSGIGLAVCRKIVESHGGRIWIEDGLDGGSSLCFSLPGKSDEPPA